MAKKRIQPDSFIERRPGDRGPARTVKQSLHQARSGGVILRSGRKRPFGWRGPSTAGVSGLFR